MIERMASRVADKKVSNFIHTGFPAAGPDDPLMECAGLMVLVLDRNRKVLGLVYARDICKAVAGTVISARP